jgi:hypothetical protein
VWGAQVGYFVAMHATRGEVIPIPSPNSINPLENVQVVSVVGWQEPSATPCADSGTTFPTKSGFLALSTQFDSGISTGISCTHLFLPRPSAW